MTSTDHRTHTHTHLVDFGSGLDELTNDHILSIVAGQMKRGVAVGVDLIDLFKGRSWSCMWGLTAPVDSVCAHINPQAQQIMHRAAHATGRSCVEGRVGFLVLTVDLGSTGH